MLPLDKIKINNHVIESYAQDSVEMLAQYGCASTIPRETTVLYRQPLNDRVGFVK